MSVTIHGTTYYRTTEVCQKIGLSRTTFLRWLKNGIFGEAAYRDRRGWRLFTEDDVNRFMVEANRIISVTDMDCETSSRTSGLFEARNEKNWYE